MKRPRRAWLVCIGCALLFFCTSGLSVNAFTVYQPYILSQNGFTNAQSSSIITVRSLFGLLGMLCTGRYYRRFSLRWGVALAGAFTVLGFALFGLAGSLPAYYGAAAVMGLGYGFGTMIPISIILEHWFWKKRTLAIGICSAFTGLSTFGLPSLLTWLILTFGLSAAFFAEAAFAAVLVLLSFLLIRGAPADGDAPYGFGEEQETSAAVGGGVHLKPSEWPVLWAMLLCLGALTSVGYSHLTVHLTSTGFDPHVTALAITASGLAMTFGKFAFGWLSDRLPVLRKNRLFAALLLAGLALLCLVRRSVPLLFLAVCAYGFGLAFTTVGITEWAGDLSTAEEYETVVRRFQLGYAAGGFVFSSLPGVLADRFGASYVPAYLFFILCAVFVTATVQWFYRHRVFQIAKKEPIA